MILSLLVIPIGTRSANMPLRQFKNITMLLIYCSMHSFIHSVIFYIPDEEEEGFWIFPLECSLEVSTAAGTAENTEAKNEGTT